MSDRAQKRLSALQGQFSAAGSMPEVELCRMGTSASSSYASATGAPSSYARVHGEVSRAPAVWHRIDSVAKEQLQDVKYEKSPEGIAKVCCGHNQSGTRTATSRLSTLGPARADYHKQARQAQRLPPTHRYRPPPVQQAPSKPASLQHACSALSIP
jgi:hypothetical protein